MNIDTQTKKAKEFTGKLLKYIKKHNKEMDKDGQGCYVTSIHLTYNTDRTIIETGFKSSNNIESPVESFYCSESVYD